MTLSSRPMELVVRKGSKQRHRRYAELQSLTARWLIVLSLCVLGSPALAFSCSMSATTIAFGNLDVTTGAAVSSTGTLTLTCSGVPSNHYLLMCVSLDGGSAYNSTSRLMNSTGGAQLADQLYTNSGDTTPWGSWPLNLYGGGYSWTPYGTNSNGTWTATVYGSVLANQQTVTAGNYSSTVNLYFTYDQHSYANGGSDSSFTCPDSRNQGNASTSFTVSATVVSNCNVSAANLNFGTVGTLTSNVDASSTMNVTCTNGAPYDVGLSAGNGTGATVTNRKMTSGGGATVNYALYQNSGRTTNWGNTVGTDTVSGTGTGSAQALTVYGRIPSQVTPAPATYTDTIVVTVTY
jgi:spore coat protein U-like protein